MNELRCSSTPFHAIEQTYPRGDEKRRLSVVSWNPKGKRKYGRIYGVQMLISVRYHEPLTLGNLGVTVANNFTK